MLGEIRGEVRFKEPLSFHTSLRMGGPADIFIVPQDVDDIRHALAVRRRASSCPSTVIGGGNNLLVRDRGIRGVVLKLEGCLGRAEFHGEEAVAGAGVGLSALIREAAALNLGGIECLVGIPATIGGALAMNAGTPRGLDRRLRQRRLLPEPGRHARRVQARPAAPSATGPSRRPPGSVLIGCAAAPAPAPARRDPRGTSRQRLKQKKSTPAAGPGLGRLRLEERADRRAGEPADRAAWGSGASACTAPRSRPSTPTSS